MKFRDYRCRFLDGSQITDCTHFEKHQGPHRVVVEGDLVYRAPGKDALWLFFGLSRSSFLVLSEAFMSDIPAKAANRLRALWAEMPVYLRYPRPVWRAQARKENGHFAGGAWGYDHMVWCRAAMHSMYDDWQREVHDILVAMQPYALEDPPGGYSISHQTTEGWRSLKHLPRHFVDYRHHRFERRLVRDLEAFQARARAWAAETFPTQNEASIIAHLRDEVNNELHEGCDPMELADVGLVLISLAGLRGISLGAVMHAKHEICRAREWVEDGGDGFPAHVKED